ncbi:alcohol dehydrogenase : S-(hydroxymethyl)glutathione dehydrogenase OS=Methylobacter marinus GN=fdh PE=3 SV=2: ADH_N_assoc: ADH_N: ADH_zinc_N [Gemmata massiliana]|uniref:Enoyl reductase (ER) domain-containing protein n=1 Tax=Gemmata massiliana TaxID=1210884 RepID=A0A6P2DG37_9BACT|nr:zinc-dependent alcohol dehydrogenase [Gemmata massiliana]VTS00662.1 alcohol dehydrogenase : S-(hydroxymethyl)glutathione dehydrogenase OS=Methylobacter marinus GN=fdh PE=3 SV=2: ADH_N_assoc: ADH_N: ADH_zinc_N [Gemmata massiliana]
MKAIVWHGKGDVRCDTAPDPKIQEPTDVIIKVTSTCICGSDLHLYDHYMPTMRAGDILGHEPMGEVVEVGRSVTEFKKGDRIVVPFDIACGECWFCQKQFYSCCDTTNPNAGLAAEAMGHAPAGLYGYSHLTGGYPGGQAGFLRVVKAGANALKIPDGMPDEQVVFLSDIFPTGYMAAENAQIEPGDTVAVWGCGPVGQFCIRSAWMLGAGRVIAIDRVPERLKMARDGGAEVINFDEVTVYDRLQEMTRGRGPDRCIEAVGCEAHYAGYTDALLDKAKTLVGAGTDRAHALREAIMCCRKAGTVSVPGVYVGFPDKIPFGAFMNKGLTMKTGQTHTQKYMKPLLEKIRAREIDPSFVITHTLKLEDGPAAYETFRDKRDGCIKVVLKP